MKRVFLTICEKQYLFSLHTSIVINNFQFILENGTGSYPQEARPSS
jgi:hypothetical protein